MISKTLREAFDLLYKEYGPQHWWPGGTPFEIMVGAILTQNTNWSNVEKAIQNLKQNSLLDPVAIHAASHETIASRIRPAGYYNIKAKRLKNFVNAFVNDYNGSVSALKDSPLDHLREWLLKVNGVGQETADSILLYALDKPVFVVDAYTKRVLIRHDLAPEDALYNDIQDLFMESLDADLGLYNEYHALIVRVAKDYCRKKPLCENCPLRNWHFFPSP